MLEGKTKYLNHFFIIFTNNIDTVGIEGEEDESDIFIADDMCDINAFNKNEHLSNWRSYKIDNGIYLIACNAKPHIDFNEFIEAYSKYADEIKILYSSVQSIEVYPWFYDQSPSYYGMKKTFKRYTNGEDQSFKEIVNYKENCMINIVEEIKNKRS